MGTSEMGGPLSREEILIDGYRHEVQFNAAGGAIYWLEGNQDRQTGLYMAVGKLPSHLIEFSKDEEPLTDTVVEVLGAYRRPFGVGRRRFMAGHEQAMNLVRGEEIAVALPDRVHFFPIIERNLYPAERSYLY